MSYLTQRDYVRSPFICLGALLVIGGSVLAIMATMEMYILGDMTMTYGAIVAVLGLVLILVGFFYTKKKRDSVLAPVDMRVEDTPPPPPPPD